MCFLIVVTTGAQQTASATAVPDKACRGHTVQVL
jgi:hypothetical protein